MLRILVATAAGLMLSGAAVAQDAYDWTGFYAGVHGGYGWGTDDVRTTLIDPTGTPYLPAATNSFDVGGILGGLQAGYNVQMDQFVVGIEGEYSASGVKGEFNFDPLRAEAVAGGDLSAIVAIKGKAGVTFDRTLVYATLGYALGANNGFANNVWSVAPADDVATGSDWMHGYVIGAGVEHAVTDQVSFKAEYNYFSFARGDFDMTSSAYPAGAVLRAEPKLDLGVIKAGLNFRF